MEVMQWARANGCPWGAKTCMYAAEAGHLHVLQYCRENNCAWNAAGTCAIASRRGYMAMLEWCHAEQGRAAHPRV